MRACSKCGCTEKRACLEFDAEGYAHACYWVTAHGCSACTFIAHIERPDQGVETRLIVQIGKRKRQFLRVPELAGMVARPR